MQRIVGVDPGIREVFYARGVDGSATHMSQGDFQSRAKLGSYTIQLASAVAAAGLPRLPDLRDLPDLGATLSYFVVRINLCAFYDKLYNCAHQAHWRMTVRRPRPRPLSCPPLSKRGRGLALTWARAP